MNNRFFKLSFPLDPQRLRADLASCQQAHWTLHFNKADYNGNWTSLSLRSASGRETDIFAHGDRMEYQNTPLLDHCPYFREILEQMPFEQQTVRLLSLGPGSTIREHTDRQLGYEFDCFRIHIPLQTGADVQFRVDGVDLPMQVGECWYANFSLPHSVHNGGTVDRIHLVIDGLRNAWTDAWFGQAGYDFDYEARQRDYSLDTKRRMIAELERQDSDIARQLVAQLRQEMAQNSPAL
ncbi:aspartyl/asparaginyl beta-hydroxylase domain-containing protein [Rudanella lutea]|uniref:aspartyl/asparaginyl beta-hydroxylase domain-containing protein n=1 Tax=Rudanella lutea TaxID=451374 RepID=UPI0003686793|nr:aspartyl/asparaginyl beta-hydroxylase domain-containing protein [Rudanella lutea]